MTTKKKIFASVGLAAVVLLAVGAVIFKPWLLFVDVEVNDEIPAATAASRKPVATAVAMGSSETAATENAAAAEATQGGEAEETGPVIVATGQFTSHEHQTSGTASIYRFPDGSHKLALENLETSNGPDVHVWLSDNPVIEGRDGWFTAKDHAHLDLGSIKGNRGNQVYDLPADINTTDWPSVVLWCDDFSVSFGAAPLA